MAKKTYKSKKSTSTIKTINIFLLILVVSASIATASYFLMKKENSSEIKKENNILQPKIENKKTQSKPIEIKQNNTIPSQTKTPPIEEPKNNQFDEYPNDDNEENDKENLDTNKQENKQKITKDIDKKEEIKAEEENKISTETKKESIQDIIKRNIEELEKEKQKELEKAKLLNNNQTTSTTSTELPKKEEPLEIKKENNKNTEPLKKEDNNEILDKNKEVINNSQIGNKPKLAIVIDDVTTSTQKNRIKNIDYKVTMAFLPPTKGHPNSAKIALDLPFYMIHFPMQASKAFKGEEANTLHTNDSYEKIEARVKQLREWYPNAIYTNNHTGSVFTAHDDGMDKLFQALKKYNFIFVDSRTASKSVAKKYAQKYGMPHISRTTFLDNNVNYASIEKQLKEAVKTAKRTGKALAIGHPHNATLKVLENSKNLLKDVEIVYVNEL